MCWSLDNSLKIVVVGDGGVGKTCLLISYTQNKFPKEHVPTVFDNYSVTVMHGQRPYQLGLFDTAGQEEYDRLRVLAYPGTDIFLVCFSLVEPESFEHVSQVWVPEIKHHCGEKVKFYIIGTKQDLRNDMRTLKELKSKNQKPVTKEQGQKLASKLGAQGYIECSALTQKGLKQIFGRAVDTVLDPKVPAEKINPVKKSLYKLICGASIM